MPSCWDEYIPTKVNDEFNTMTIVMQAMNRDCKRSNNISKEIEIKRQAIANIKNLFRDSTHCSTSLPLPLWMISLSAIRSFTKGHYNKQLQWSTQDRSCNTPFPEYVLSCVFRFFNHIFLIYFLYLFCFKIIYVIILPWIRIRELRVSPNLN